jgi:hypothetical protein
MVHAASPQQAACLRCCSRLPHTGARCFTRTASSYPSRHTFTLPPMLAIHAATAQYRRPDPANLAEQALTLLRRHTEPHNLPTLPADPVRPLPYHPQLLPPSTRTHNSSVTLAADGAGEHIHPKARSRNHKQRKGP